MRARKGGGLLSDRRVAATLVVALWITGPTEGQGQVVTPKRPDAARVAHLERVIEARRVLYPAFDATTGMTGETFVSRSLGRRAEDMALVYFDLAVVSEGIPGSAAHGIHVAAAILKPVGFPPSYTLIEVARLDPGPDGLRLVANLKVRVDSGVGDGRLTMRLEARSVGVAGAAGAVSRPGPDAVRFDVVVIEAGTALRHRFAADGDRITLVESVPAR